MTQKGRFAPSPSGRMHLGNLFSFLMAWLDARSAGGKIVLRMEDLDPDRTGGPLTPQLADDLKWLGLDWDEGYGLGGPHAPYEQSARTACYDEAFRALEAKGLVYPCWCSRAQRLAASAPHPGEERDPGVCPCRTLSRAEREARSLVKAPAWKAAVPHEWVAFTDLHFGPQRFHLAHDCGDFILRRADGVYGYQLAVTVDDGLMGVTRVVRGRDLLDSTPWQLWLMGELGFDAPVYGHVPMLLAGDGRRLSKRERDLDMGVLRRTCGPEALVGGLAGLAGLAPRGTCCAARELISNFSWGDLPKNDLVMGS